MADDLCIRDDVDLDGGRELGEALSQGRLAPEVPAFRTAAAEDDLRDAGDARVLGDLCRDVVAVGGDDFRAELRREADVRLEARLILAAAARSLPIQPVQACAICPAMRTMRSFDGEEERQTRICSFDGLLDFVSAFVIR